MKIFETIILSYNKGLIKNEHIYAHAILKLATVILLIEDIKLLHPLAK